MKKLLLCAAIVAFQFGFSQKGQFHLNPDGGQHQLYVAFDPVQVRDGKFPQAVDVLVAEYQMQLVPGISISPEKLDRLAADAKRLSGSSASVTKLRTIYLIRLPEAENSELLALAEKLEALKEVRYCELVSLSPVVPPSDIPPVTPDFHPLQTYFQANPGVNMDYAHGMGLTGSGIRIRDVEYGINTNHEEFVDNPNIAIAPGMTINDGANVDYTEHGTAVAGIMCADNGTYGVTGLSYSAGEYLLFPEWQQSGYNRVLAISESISASQAGDVILFELQADGAAASSTDYVPEEYNALSWDLTKAATDAGIVIVAAAGNGNQNLDSSLYQTYMNRGDSGAILVGAGSPDTGHNKIWYSTYGSRINVQGWADNVYATGYGDQEMVGDDFNQNYTIFSGTSSATPIVAGCAVALQQFAFEQTGDYLLPSQIRDLLVTTGVAQGTGGNIGPLPDMQAALTALAAQLGVQKPDEVVFTVYPNPVSDRINIFGNLPQGTTATLYNVAGQQLLDQEITGDASIAIDGLASGMYILKIRNGKAVTTQKILVR